MQARGDVNLLGITNFGDNAVIGSELGDVMLGTVSPETPSPAALTVEAPAGTVQIVNGTAGGIPL